MKPWAIWFYLLLFISHSSKRLLQISCENIFYTAENDHAAKITRDYYRLILFEAKTPGILLIWNYGTSSKVSGDG